MRKPLFHPLSDALERAGAPDGYYGPGEAEAYIKEHPVIEPAMPVPELSDVPKGEGRRKDAESASHGPAPIQPPFGLSVGERGRTIGGEDE